MRVCSIHGSASFCFTPQTHLVQWFPTFSIINPFAVGGERGNVWGRCTALGFESERCSAPQVYRTVIFWEMFGFDAVLYKKKNYQQPPPPPPFLILSLPLSLSLSLSLFPSVRFLLYSFSLALPLPSPHQPPSHFNQNTFSIHIQNKALRRKPSDPANASSIHSNGELSLSLSLSLLFSSTRSPMSDKKKYNRTLMVYMSFSTLSGFPLQTLSPFSDIVLLFGNEIRF